MRTSCHQEKSVVGESKGLGDLGHGFTAPIRPIQSLGD